MDGYDGAMDTGNTRDNSVLLQISLNSSILLLPQWMMPQLAGLLAQLQAVEGYGTSAKAVPVTFNMERAKSYVTRPISEREAELQKEVDQRNNWWNEERQKAAKLERRVKELEGQLPKSEPTNTYEVPRDSQF